MATGTPTAGFAIVLDDKTSGPAASAAGALSQLKTKIESDTKALREMQAAMSRLKGSTVATAAQQKILKDKIDAQKASIASAQSEWLKLGGKFSAATHQAGAVSKGFEHLLGASKRLPGPLGGVAGQLEYITKLVGGAGGIAVAGTLALAAAFVVLSAGAVVAIGSLLQYALAQSDARRSELHHLESLDGLSRTMNASMRRAEGLQSAIDSVADASPLARAEVVSLASRLQRAGVDARTFEARLQSLAQTSAQKQYGTGALQAMMGLGVQTRKLHENIARLFSGLHIDAFLTSLHSVLELFSQTTASGRAMKAVIESVLQPMIDGLTRAGPIARRFFQGMIIAALHVGIAIMQVRAALHRAFGKDIGANIDTLKVALYGGMIAFGALTVVVGVLAAAMGALLVSVALLTAPFVIVAAAIGGLIFAGMKVVTWFRDMEWSALGTSLISGLVSGLVAGKNLVVSTVQSIAHNATAALSDALGIHSPSRVFAELGQQIPRGLAVGVEAGTPDALSAVRGMTQDASSPSSVRSSQQVSVGPFYIDIHSSGGVDEMVETLEEKVTKMFEGVAVKIGAPQT